MIRLRCLLCTDHPLVVGREVVHAHVAGHRLVEEAVRVIWASAEGLVLRREER